MGAFGSRLFWKRNAVFALMFHLWENVCHWRFEAHAADVTSICCRRGIYHFTESGAESLRWVEMFREADTKGMWGAFPSTYGPCFGLYTQNLSADP